MAEQTPDVPASATVSDQISLTCSAEYTSYPLSEQTCWSVTSLKAPFYEPTARASVDIVAVIDKSGSMSGEKIRLVRKTLLFVIDQLKDCDRMSLVTYDSSVSLNFALMKMTKPNKDRARSFVEAIREGSCTNLCGGLLKGMEQIADTKGDEGKGKVQSVLLLTDGLANEGITGTANILNVIKKYQEEGKESVQKYTPPSGPSMRFQQQQRVRSAPQPQPGFFGRLFGNRAPPQQQAVPVQQQVIQQQAMPTLDVEEPMKVEEPEPEPKPKGSGTTFDGTIYTFGFGSDHDASLLEAISTQGGGVYYYIDSNEKIPESFADCLGGLLSVVGQNLSLKLELQGGNSVNEVHANRAINWTTPNKTCDIAMGDLQSEEERDIVMELTLPALSSPQQNLVIKASLSYFNVITSALDTVTFDFTIDRKDEAQGPAKESVDVQRNRIIATSALKKAEALADQGKLKEAKTMLSDAIKRLESSASGQQEFCKALISDLKRSIDSMATDDSYRGHGKLYMHSKAQSHAVQRSNFVDDSSYYQTSSKVAMRSKAKW